ncbi:MAG TPA: DUF2231 domain-containing protein [Pyrinomonadaceae bacterium]|jgi:uncharacterized membrane protein|nr:DUF2231 domain-containing protein [Pyrinomonadaceae bacterium]
MESKFKILGHGAHPILIVFPLGLLATAAIFDIIYLLTNNQQIANAAYWMIAAGVVGGIVAAVPGFVDWWAIPQGTRAKRVGLIHGLGNDAVLVIFGLSWWLRRDTTNHAPETVAFILSMLGVGLSLFTGWLGGELVERLGMAVHDGAHLDAPNTLSGRPARDRE